MLKAHMLRWPYCSAVCRLPSAVCRLPSAVCRLPQWGTLGHFEKTRLSGCLCPMCPASSSPDGCHCPLYVQ